MAKIEICLASDNIVALKKNLLLIANTQVRRIELCCSMHVGGLTPSVKAIQLARNILPDTIKIMVMIRPREGYFVYTDVEIKQMLIQIAEAEKAGADGVVFGALTVEHKLNLKQMKVLSARAKKLNLLITFHRAFDVVTNRALVIKQLIDLKINHILTSGLAWESEGSALDGIENIKHSLQYAESAIEIIIGGGVNVTNAPRIINSLANDGLTTNFSIHAYSGVLNNENIQPHLINTLCDVELSRIDFSDI